MYATKQKTIRMSKQAKGFDDLEFIPHTSNGIKALMDFANGFGVSVIRSDVSYGSEMGLYELTILKKDGGVCYDTPVTNDVLGHLTTEGVTAAMAEVQGL